MNAEQNSFNGDASRYLSKALGAYEANPEFLQELGMAVSTFGLLERILEKAIAALAPQDDRWLDRVLKVVSDPLGSLINEFEKQLKPNGEWDTELSIKINLPEFIKSLRDALLIRNMLCHSYWIPGKTEGKMKPVFANRNREVVISEYSSADLRHITNCVQEMIRHCMNTVTMKGIQFPGTDLPGEKVI